MAIVASTGIARVAALVLAIAGCANPNGIHQGGSPNPFEALIGPLLPTDAANAQRAPGARPPPNARQAVPPRQVRARPPQSPAGAQAEAAMRAQLLQQAGGFGGIFGPSLNQWANTPSGGGGGGDACGGRYNEYAAQQACRSGNGWAADRLENQQSDGAERDWYNR